MSDPTALLHVTRAQLQAHVDREIAELARRQHGVVARWQLAELGLGRGAIADRVRRGLLHRLHRGVYAWGHAAVAPRGRLMAAVLAIGPDAVLSHRDAAALHAIRANGRTRVEVTVSRAVRSRRAIQVHVAALPPDEITVVDGIPVTTVPRTLLDLAAVLDARRLERAVHEAEVQRLWDALSLVDLLERYPRRPGAPAVRAVLVGMGHGLKLTRNEFEAAFLALVEDAGLPRPALNEGFELGGRWIEPDCCWPDARLIVELDGGLVHRTAKLFESDRERDRLLQVAGWRVVRVTWRQLEHDGARIIADLRSLLTR